jgi:hypothetical protein
MSGESEIGILVIAGVHLLGLACAAVLLIPALRDAPAPPPPTDPESDDGGGRGPRRRPKAPGSPPGGGLPLPISQPAHVRLRGHERLSDLTPPRQRRPAREPERDPVRSRETS